VGLRRVDGRGDMAGDGTGTEVDKALVWQSRFEDCGGCEQGGADSDSDSCRGLDVLRATGRRAAAAVVRFDEN
jgi:hypothetical protein